jgi:1-deoxy-D-xylulose-5-phosphate reductoisomerase
LEKRKVIVLGSTGTIGKATLEVVRGHPQRFQVVALSCHQDRAELDRQVAEFRPAAVTVTGLPPGEARGSEPREYRGQAGLLQMIEGAEADVVVNGIAGAAGLLPSLASLRAGKRLALANKETIVMAGPLVMEEAHRRGLDLIPVDSEHHALFLLLRGLGRERAREVVLTASGGAFRDLSLAQLKDVGPEDALKHPTWRMGAKITVDSATMANKGLEVIEAHYLFGFPVSSIEVLLHPQCYVHALVRSVEGFCYAQISQPDMRLPIQNALTYPEVVACPFGSLELAGRSFDFLPVDGGKYRLLALAYSAAEAGGGYPVAYNAANEVAVAHFLHRKIAFLQIPALVEQTLQADWSHPLESIPHVLEMDGEARTRAAEVLQRLRRIA